MVELDELMNLTSEIARESDRILMCLVSSNCPAQAIQHRYESAHDKDVFVAALTGNLILRHKQWQAALGREHKPQACGKSE